MVTKIYIFCPNAVFAGHSGSNILSLDFLPSSGDRVDRHVTWVGPLGRTIIDHSSLYLTQISKCRTTISSKYQNRSPLYMPASSLVLNDGTEWSYM